MLTLSRQSDALLGKRLLPAIGLLLVAILVPPATAAAPDAAATEHFEKKIRPVLVKHCYQCHAAGSKSVKGGLLLDTREGGIKGGDSGPAVVPGKVDESLLIDALKYDGFEMPPKGKLPQEVIDDFVKWIKLGAVDPREGDAVIKSAAIDIEAGRKFWSFTPPRKVAPPAVKQADWPRDAIDRFVLAGLEAKTLAPVADAGRRTVIRRLYFDLVGLPPEPVEIEAFVKDQGPKAIEKVVDRLLASPQFGERWGRHWLDIARYSDSTGGGRSKIYANAWRYRDYVIRSMNSDKPYNEFTAEQIAGDLMPHKTDQAKRDGLTATGFLVLGPANYENQDKELLRMEVIDEQISTMGTAMLAMTLGCARCHDHKFDPIPTSDYYALAGIFRSTKTLTPGNVSGFVERPLAVSGEQLAAFTKHEQVVKKLADRIKQSKTTLAGLQGKDLPRNAAPLVGIVVDDAQAQLKGAWTKSTSNRLFVGQGYIHDNRAGKGEKSITFVPEIPADGMYEVRLATPSGTNRDAQVPVTIRHAEGETVVKVNEQPTPPINGLFHSLGRFKFAQGKSGSVILSNKNTTGHVIADAAQFISVSLLDGDAVKAATPEPPKVTPEKKAKIKQTSAQLKKLEADLAALNKSALVRPMAMSVQEESKTADWHVHIRGEIRNLGPLVPRGFVSVAAQGKPTLAEDESGRLQLAQWISSADNPLTARVFVNRVWHHLFGAGLVRTVDNFGTTGQLPSHPELLDWLAIQFIEDGWSLKKLIRQIVLTRTYGLSASSSDQAMAVDPENRLLWRASRRRLDAEAIRDAILSVSGQLDLTPGGFTVNRSTKAKEYNYEYNTVRRSVYVPVLRNSMLGLFGAFDFADPNLVVGGRTTSAPPTQALYLMNSPFMMEQSRVTAEGLLKQQDLDDAGRLDLLYQQALGRSPQETEKQFALGFLSELTREKQTEALKLQAWTGICQAVFSSVDFRYLK